MKASDPNDVRRLLTQLCRSRGARRHTPSDARPCDWRPTQVADPRSHEGLPFSPAGAWEFVADQLESGCEIKEIVLDKPPGKRAYVVLADGARGHPRIYVKLELGAGVVYARSFHSSKY